MVTSGAQRRVSNHGSDISQATASGRLKRNGPAGLPAGTIPSVNTLTFYARLAGSVQIAGNRRVAPVVAKRLEKLPQFLIGRIFQKFGSSLVIRRGGPTPAAVEDGDGRGHTRRRGDLRRSCDGNQNVDYACGVPARQGSNVVRRSGHRIGPFKVVSRTDRSHNP